MVQQAQPVQTVRWVKWIMIATHPPHALTASLEDTRTRQGSHPLTPHLITALHARPARNSQKQGNRAVLGVHQGRTALPAW
jgi:hypothetical protein